MVEISTYDVASGSKGSREADFRLGDQLLYRTMKEAVVQYQANRRQGDAHTKVRSELARHRQKPWRQKKTGRARAGDRRSPLWVGGATLFGPRNRRRWDFHLPRKQRLVALRSALLGKIRDGEVCEAGGLSWEEPSAREARKVLAGCGMEGSVLVLTTEHDDAVWKSFRNFPRVSVRPAMDANAYDLLAHRWVLAQDGALQVLVNRAAMVLEEEAS